MDSSATSSSSWAVEPWLSGRASTQLQQQNIQIDGRAHQPSNSTSTSTSASASHGWERLRGSRTDKADSRNASSHSNSFDTNIRRRFSPEIIYLAVNIPLLLPGDEQKAEWTPLAHSEDHVECELCVVRWHLDNLASFFFFLNIRTKDTLIYSINSISH